MDESVRKHISLNLSGLIWVVAKTWGNALRKWHLLECELEGTLQMLGWLEVTFFLGLKTKWLHSRANKFTVNIMM